MKEIWKQAIKICWTSFIWFRFFVFAETSLLGLTLSACFKKKLSMEKKKWKENYKAVYSVSSLNNENNKVGLFEIQTHENRLRRFRIHPSRESNTPELWKENSTVYLPKGRPLLLLLLLLLHVWVIAGVVGIIDRVAVCVEDVGRAEFVQWSQSNTWGVPETNSAVLVPARSRF